MYKTNKINKPTYIRSNVRDYHKRKSLPPPRSPCLQKTLQFCIACSHANKDPLTLSQPYALLATWKFTLGCPSWGEKG